MSGFFARWQQRRHCPHSNLQGIFGDAINHTGGFRLRCWDCGRYLDGAAALAKLREL
jgi:hypothetical protein